MLYVFFFSAQFMNYINEAVLLHINASELVPIKHRHGAKPDAHLTHRLSKRIHHAHPAAKS